MSKLEMRSSCDEFVCIGGGRERLISALSLALCRDCINAWIEKDGAIHVACHYGEHEWNKLPDGITAIALVELFYGWLMKAPSVFKGYVPDGSTAKGWRVRVDYDCLPAVVILEPWTLCYAK